VLLSDFSKDQGGRKFIPGDLVATLARVASVPVYGIARNWIGDGVVGGGVMDFGDDGARTGGLLVRVLERAPNEAMPASEVAINRLVVDWRQVQRWDLPADRLPPGTEILFRPASLWERYRGGILAVLGLFVVESLLIALLLVERKRRVRAQHAVEQARGQLEHMARVATVNGLAAAVSHELRQPLAAIRMNAEAGGLLLTQTPPDVTEARLALQAIVRDDVRAGEVIDHYRALLRKQEPISTAVDLNAVCRTTAQLVEHEASGRRARLVLRLDPEVPPVRGDPVQLQQVLINLTLNALDAVSISTSEREAAIRTVRNNGDVEVHVSDTGPGLAPEVQQRLFEPFFSTKPHGLGMGLTIVRSIVERHNGRLHAENRPAGGAHFTVTLPAGDAKLRS
jgi:C4-dicarboxylate-specific signal transduction histidine kinase